jgi:hypothetical protein
VLDKSALPFGSCASKTILAGRESWKEIAESQRHLHRHCLVGSSPIAPRVKLCLTERTRPHSSPMKALRSSAYPKALHISKGYWNDHYDSLARSRTVGQHNTMRGARPYLFVLTEPPAAERRARAGVKSKHGRPFRCTAEVLPHPWAREPQPRFLI